MASILSRPQCAKFQWNFDWNSNIFIQENALENVVCEMASIFSRPQCVKRVNCSGTLRIPTQVYGNLKYITGMWNSTDNVYRHGLACAVNIQNVILKLDA